MGMFNFVLDSIKGEIFDFKVKRQVLVASTVCKVDRLLTGLTAQQKKLLDGVQIKHLYS